MRTSGMWSFQLSRSRFGQAGTVVCAAGFWGRCSSSRSSRSGPSGGGCTRLLANSGGVGPLVERRVAVASQQICFETQCGKASVRWRRVATRCSMSYPAGSSISYYIDGHRRSKSASAPRIAWSTGSTVPDEQARTYPPCSTATSAVAVAAGSRFAGSSPFAIPSPTISGSSANRPTRQPRRTARSRSKQAKSVPLRSFPGRTRPRRTRADRRRSAGSRRAPSRPFRRNGVTCCLARPWRAAGSPSGWCRRTPAPATGPERSR